MSNDNRRAPEGPAATTMEVTHAGTTAVVTVTGELDLLTARDLMATVDDVQQSPQVGAVVVDLTAVSFLGSAGLGTLAELATRTAAPAGSGGYRAEPPRPLPPLRLVAGPDNRAVIRPWETMNLQQILPLHADLAHALGSL